MLTGHIMFQQAGLIAVSFFILGCGMWTTIICTAVLSLPVLGYHLNMMFSRLSWSPTAAASPSVTSSSLPHGLPTKWRRIWGKERVWKTSSCQAGSISSTTTSFPPRLSRPFSLARSCFPLVLTSCRRWRENHWTVYILQTGFSFAVAIFIITQGVRMFVAELSEAFNGISQRLIPGAVLAIDCAAIYSFAPNAVVWGFMGHHRPADCRRHSGWHWLFNSDYSGLYPMFFSTRRLASLPTTSAAGARLKICLVMGMVEIFGCGGR